MPKPINTPLTDEQKLFIKQYALDERWTDDRIAAELNISKHTVRKWRKKFGIVKSGEGKISVSKSQFTKDNINAINISEDEKIEEWKKFFRTTERYKRLTKLYIPEDLEIFVEMWGRFSTQFTTMSISDEEALEQLIAYKLRLDDNKKDYRSILEQEVELKKMLNGRGDKELNLEDENERFIWETIHSNNRLKTEKNEEMKILTAEYEKYFRMLNATREQREQREKIGADTFLTLVRMMNDQERRRDAGRYNELMKIAINKKTQQLKEAHKFIDGGISPIILDGADYKKEKKNE